ncbi:MAG: hypothetical protein DBX55_02920 [Verrucomicrobia bacterium]|nr:MAG: hypothetical protein DBX55_02920 [Verrucomicrobiota bacterium]
MFHFFQVEFRGAARRGFISIKPSPAIRRARAVGFEITRAGNASDFWISEKKGRDFFAPRF